MKTMLDYKDLTLLIVFLTAFFLSRATCWQVWNSTCYLFVNNRVDYDQSKSSCENMFAYVVEVETMQEYTEILQYMDPSEDYWTGAQKNTFDNDYHWTVGGGTVLGSLWESDAPDHYDTCVRFRAGGSHKLNDKSCSSQYSYICEKLEDMDAYYSCTRTQTTNSIYIRGHTAKQSSVLYVVSTSGTPGNAIDGSYNTGFTDCASTDVGTEVWWQVDLKGHFLVTSVTITNRKDCCEGYLRDLQIQVHSANPVTYGENSSYTLCANYTGPAPATETNITIQCDTMTAGRYLRILKTSPSNSADSMLTLCEVDVYGEECTKEQEIRTCETPVIKYNISNTQQYTTQSQPLTSERPKSTTLSTTTEDTTPGTTTSSKTTDDTTPGSTILSTTTKDTTIDITESTSPTSVSTEYTTSVVSQTTKCSCPCTVTTTSNMTEEQITESVRQIIKELKVETKTTSSYIRSLVSADDQRPSSKGVGSIGIAMLVLVFMFIVAGDAVDIVHFIYHKVVSRRKHINLTI